MTEKAKIINIVTGEEVECMFNPKEYSFAKQNQWTETPTKKKGVSHLEFSGGQPANLKVQLLFDTYEDHPKGKAGGDVRQKTAALWKMMEIIKGREPEEPPHCQFKWGALWSFEAVIESISQKFTLFDSSGKPLRAILDVSFKQVKDAGQYPRQNPTSGGLPGEHLRTIREGETLAGIAYDEYGDATVWRYLAEENRIQDPRRLRPGQVLIVKPLPL